MKNISNGVVTKYYFFAGQRIAMKRDGVLTYLHADHPSATLRTSLGSIVVTTNISGSLTSSRGYRAYGNYRRGGDLPTDYRFTGQQQDASGLIYMNARYYDPVLGQFISPDTLIPDPSNVQDYNRYMYARGNPLRFTDPSGHNACMALAPVAPLVLGCQAGEFVMRYGPTVMQLAVQWADKLPAVGDWLFSSNAAEQGAHSAGQSNGGNTAGPGGLDPNDLFRNASDTIRRGVEMLRTHINNPSEYQRFRYGAQAHLSRAEYYYQQGALKSVNPSGKGSIDLVLTNNTGVEVKYWSAQSVFDDIRVLESQLRGFDRVNLDHIVVEFVQTRGNPVTQAVLMQLQTQLKIEFGLNLSKFTFTVVSNPGIP